jgi:hypothetical protein
MKNIILTLSLVACGSKNEPPDEEPKDTTAKVDTIEDSENNVLEVPDINVSGYNFPERCTTIMENRDNWIAPKEKELRPKICNLTGIDQVGRENNLYDFEGDVIVLVIMNTVCNECRAWLHNDGPYQQLRRLDVRTINVITTNNDGLWASPSDVAKLHTDHNLSNYPVLAVDPRVIGEGSEQFKPYRNDHYFPMFYIIDKNMRLAWSSTGQPWHDSFHAWTEWHAPVQDLILE